MFNKKQTTDPGLYGGSLDATELHARADAHQSTTTHTTETTTTSTNTTATTSTNASTFLADGSSFTGKAQIAGTMRIEGKADGETRSHREHHRGKSGLVQATLKTRRAVLNGRFNGKIDATDRVELQNGSRVEAEIHAKNMVMEDGVQFSGNCRVGQ